MTILEANNLTRMFGSHTALSDFSLSVEPGEIVGLIGPSGGGKTTAVRLMCGIDRPDEGNVTVFGRPIAKLRTKDRRRIALLAQDPAIIPEFTIAEQVRLAARLRGVRADIESTLATVGLDEQGDRRLADASGGMRRRAGLAATLVSNPELAFLDEPTAGLDPIIRDELWVWFRSRRKDGRAMVVTTQHIDEAARCDRVIVLRTGTVIADATPTDLRAEAGLAEQLLVHVPVEQIVVAKALLTASGMVVARRRNTLIVASDDAAARAADVAALLASNNVAATSLETVTPGLDDIFRTLVEQ